MLCTKQYTHCLAPMGHWQKTFLIITNYCIKSLSKSEALHSKIEATSKQLLEHAQNIRIITGLINTEIIRSIY